MKTLIKKTLILLGAPLIFIKISTAQNSQPLAEFNKIKVGDLVHVELIQADRYSAYTESGQALNLKVDNGTLVIDHASAGSDRIKVYAPEIRSIELDDQASVTCKDTLRSEDLHVEIDGAASADLLVANTNMKIDLDGAARLEINGRTQNLTAEVDGAARLRAQNLTAQNVTIETDGAASASISPVSTLNATSDGMSHIDFSGNPPNKTLTIDGLSSIKALTSGEVFDDKAVTEGPDKNENDTTRFKLGNRKLLIIGDEKDAKKQANARRRMKPVYAGFEMGVNGFTTPSMNMNFENPYKFMNTRLGNSWFFGLNLFEVNGHIIKNKLALTTGFGMQWSNYRFDGDTYLTPNIDSLGGTTSGVALKSNKLYTFDLNAPILLKFAPGTKKSSKGGFHIAAGAIVRYVTTTRVTTETTANGYTQRTKFDDDFNINPFRVDATVRVGFDRVKLFVNYGLTPYFNNSKAPDIRTFAAGITVVGF